MRLIIFLTLISSTSVFGQNKQIKQKVEKRLNQSGLITTQIVEDFNEQGHLYKRSVIDSYGMVNSYRTYKVGSDGQVIADTGFDQSNEIIDIWSYEYDSKGEIIKQTRNYPKRGDVYVEIFEISYDKDNNITELKQFNKDSILEWIHSYEYDHADLIRYVSKFQGTIRNERMYTYKKGLMIEEILYDYENDELRQRENTLYFFKYDKSGKLINKTVHSVAEHLKEKIITEHTYSYNKENNVISEISIERGKIESRKEFDYKYW